MKKKEKLAFFAFTLKFKSFKYSVGRFLLSEQIFITKWGSFFLLQSGANCITKWDSWLSINISVITKWGKFYYKVGQVLQTGALLQSGA